MVKTWEDSNPEMDSVLLGWNHQEPSLNPSIPRSAVKIAPKSPPRTERGRARVREKEWGGWKGKSRVKQGKNPSTDKTGTAGFANPALPDFLCTDPISRFWLIWEGFEMKIDSRCLDIHYMSWNHNIWTLEWCSSKRRLYTWCVWQGSCREVELDLERGDQIWD